MAAEKMALTGAEYFRMNRLSPDEGKRQLSALWETVFGDGPNYTSVFLDSAAFRPEDTVLSLEEGRLAAMLFLLPVRFGGRRGRYVYAVATHPAFRGRGHAGAMLEYAQGLTEERGEDFTCLHPASDSLFGFYRRFGFETAFYIREERRRAPEGVPLLLERVPAEEFPALYTGTLSKRREPLLRWGEETLPFLCREAEAQEGGVLSIQGGEGFCLFTCPEQGRVEVKELAFSGGITGELLDSLAGHWRGKDVSFRLPGDSALENPPEKNAQGAVLQPFGMIKYKKELLALQSGGTSAYGFMGIALD